jgi:cbb3-type cytochrome oxidase subunit 3
MKLSDVMSSMGLAAYAEIAMVIFLAVFLAVALQLLRKKNIEAYERARLIPLDDDTPVDRRSDEEAR